MTKHYKILHLINYIEDSLKRIFNALYE